MNKFWTVAAVGVGVAAMAAGIAALVIAKRRRNLEDDDVFLEEDDDDVQAHIAPLRTVDGRGYDAESVGTGGTYVSAEGVRDMW